jgi:hypothetical protein
VVEHDGWVSSREVVVVSRPYQSEGDVRTLATDLLASTMGLMVYSTQTVWALGEATARTVVGSMLDRIVPTLTEAIVSRMNLTDVVLRNVDLYAVVTAALDELDLTQIVVDRVDVDQIVDRADIDAVVDRVPMLQIADYIIEEIDLPQIIRESTGGIAMDAFTTTRFSAVKSDEVLSKIVGTLMFRRKDQQSESHIESDVPPETPVEAPNADEAPR